MTVLGDALSLVRRVATGALGELDADRALMRTMAGFIEASKSRYALDRGAVWKPGEPLRLLFAGYSGTRNTGADVRVEEMVRQFRHLLGDDLADLSILTIDPALSKGYFRTVKQLYLPRVFPKFLYDTVHAQHGVVACEGSMFKSKFANALATMMVGSLGLALAEDKLAIGYGGEAGSMDPALEDLVRKYCKGAFILARNEASRDVLGRLGIPALAGTDTAWTFDPAPPAVAEALLTRAGWDGRTPVLALAPINPFVWPVKPDLWRGAAVALGADKPDSHYDSIYFHADSPERREKQRTYIAAIAHAVERFRAETPCFPICIGMEQLDRRAAEALAAELGGAPVFVSDKHDMYEMVSVLRRSSWLLSSRYHAIVTSMPGLLPSAGITMDERIANLMDDRGQPGLSLRVDDPALAEHAYAALAYVRDHDEAVRDAIARSVVRNLVRMGEMGRATVDHLRARLPALPVSASLGGDADPWRHLPPLPRAVEALVSRVA